MPETSKAEYPVVIVGEGLISAKLLGAVMEMAYVLNDREQLVKHIEFDAEVVRNGVGVSIPKLGVVKIYLRELTAQLLAMYRTEGEFLTMQANWVAQILDTVGHELGHIWDQHKYGVEYDGWDMAKREKSAIDFGTGMLALIMEKFDVEPVALEDEPYLSMVMQEVFIKDMVMPWVVRERRLMADKLVYEDNARHQLGSLREFFRLKLAKDEQWRQATYPVRVEFNKNEKGETPVFEPNMPAAVAAVPPPMAAPVNNVIYVEEGTEVYAEDMPPTGVADIPDGAEGTLYEEDGHIDGEPLYAPKAATPVYAAPAQPITAKEVPMTTGLKLPAHIAAMKAGYATGAAAVSAPKATPQPKVFPPNNYPAEKMIAFMNAVYERLHFHIFNECEWTGTPAMGAQDWKFNNPGGVVAKPVNITDLIHAHGMADVVMEYNTHDANGKKLWGDRAEKCKDGLIRGEVFSKSQLPGYTLYLNFYGNGYKRVVTPQNIAKTTSYALRARAGECITWVIADEKVDNDKMLGHFENETWIPAVKR